MSGFAGEMDKPENTSGYANCFGDVQFSGHLGSIAISRSEVYPFYYQYSSGTAVSSPHLGRGFFVPLMECRLVDYDYAIEFTTLGGARGYLFRLPADPDRYLSRNGRISGQRLGDNTFVRKTDDGFTMTYRNGRLSEFQSPSGAVVNFRYSGSGDICESVISSTGESLVSFRRTGERGVEFRTRRGLFQVEMGGYPARYDPEMDAAGELPDLEPTVASIRWPDENVSRFDYEQPDDSRVIMTMSYGAQDLKFEWRQSTGQILRAGETEYRVTGISREFDPSAEHVTVGTWSVWQKRSDGSWNLYQCDEDAAIIEENSDDSDRTRTWLIPNRGPAFWKVRKIEKFREGRGFSGVSKGGKTGWETVYEAFYDKDGRIIREIDGGRPRWHLHPGGLPASIVKPEDDFFVFDDQRRLKRRRVEGAETVIDWSIDGSRRIVSKYPWGEVNLRYYDANGNPSPIPKSDDFPEQAQARVSNDAE